MLTLTVKDGQTITIGDNILIHINFIGDKQARIHVKAPRELDVVHFRDQKKPPQKKPQSPKSSV